MLQSSSDAVIVHSTIDLGRNLGLRVVAEGVENALTLQQLDLLGCHAVQGYHISRPVAPDDLIKLDRTAGRPDRTRSWQRRQQPNRSPAHATSWPAWPQRAAPGPYIAGVLSAALHSEL
jgi:hypothetical protein